MIHAVGTVDWRAGAESNAAGDIHKDELFYIAQRVFWLGDKLPVWPAFF